MSRKTTALVLGGGDTLIDDVERYTRGASSISKANYDIVVACNDAGTWWRGRLDAWVTLHPEKLKAWVQKRESCGHRPASELYSHRYPGCEMGSPVIKTKIEFPGQNKTGSSGLFAAKVALCDLGVDRAVLCGIPMTQTPHYFDAKPWTSAEGFRAQWLTVPKEFRDRMRSMSGWSRALLGSPEWMT